MNVPVFTFDAERTDSLYHAHRALEAQERRYPALARNEHWVKLRKQARDEFAAEFKAVMG